MKKSYLLNGTEVHLGDVISKTKEVNYPLFGKGKETEYILLTKKVLPKYIKEGIITVKQVEGKSKLSIQEDSEIPMNLDFYACKIADRLNWKIEKVYGFLNKVHSILPAAAFSILLREIAIELDKKYEDHIEKSPEIYVISMLDGRITKANKAHIKSYRNFAAFRSVEDAKIACGITKDILKDLFKNGK